MEILSEFTPVFAELLAKVGQSETPRPRTQKCVEVEAAAGHADDSGGKCDESADHWQQAGDEYGEVSPAREEAVGPVEFAAAHQDPAAIALDQRAPTVGSDLVGHQRSQVASDRAHSRHPEQLECALKYEVSGERHDQFGWQRDAGGLDCHEDGDACVARGRNDLADKDEEDGEDLFSHFWQYSVLSSRYSVNNCPNWRTQNLLTQFSGNLRRNRLEESIRVAVGSLAGLFADRVSF